MISKTTSLICTLGGQPQVVTFALDALLDQGTALSEVIVLHFSPPNERLRHSLQKLRAEFAAGRYEAKAVHLVLYPLRTEKRPIPDIHDEADANAAWEVINQLFIDLKNQHHTLHVCISGGRRILGLLTMSAAMLHFGHQDVLWHMYTPRDVRLAANEGAIMHLPPDVNFRLIRVPMMPWGSYFPALRQLARPFPDTTDVLAAPRQLLDEVDRQHCLAVIQRLTGRQQDVLRAFAAGLNPQEVADHLSISIKTVDSHKTVILSECRNAWNIPENGRLDYRFLVEKFSSFFQQQK
ncbi:MAG: histidine kinase [Chloroflexi bacterium]|nr:MAG: histidine kinase [Chloroflexota bacterium]